MPEPGALKRLLLLRRPDQAVIGALTLVGMLALGGWYVAGSTGGRAWIDIDAAPTLTNTIVVNVNTANEAELMLLPEIGIGTSAKILAAREAGGPFRSPRDLQDRVKGIGPKTIEKLKPLLSGWTEAGAK